MLRFSLVLILTLPLLIHAQDPKGKRSREPVKLTEKALKIHHKAILIDGHNDLPWQLRNKAQSSFTNFDLTKDLTKRDLHTDIPRLKKGGVGAQFWSAYVPADRAKTKTAVRETLEQIDVIHRMVKQYPDHFEMAGTVEDILRIREQGKIACMIGVEGGHSIDNSLGVLRTYYQLGVRYMTLTHSDNVDWADSATDEPKHHGLTKFGEEVVYEMNRLGMFVDISHVSVETMKHALRVTKAPVIASHSSARGIADHPRNVPDDVLKLVKKNGGVIMINFYSGFVVPESARMRKDAVQQIKKLQEQYPEREKFLAALEVWRKEYPIKPGTIHDVVDHIDHVVKVAGVDHVGLGSDYDGIGMVPKQLEDVSTYPLITQELLNRGYTEKQIHKILGGNVLRAFREMEKVSKQLRAKK